MKKEEQVKTLARLEKDGEVYEVQVDLADYQVYGVQMSPSGTVEGKWKKGKPNRTLLSALEIARKTMNKKMIQDGFRKVTDSFRELSDDLFKEETGGEVQDARKPGSTEPKRGAKFYLNMNIAELAMRARQELLELGKARRVA